MGQVESALVSWMRLKMIRLVSRAIRGSLYFSSFANDERLFALCLAGDTCSACAFFPLSLRKTLCATLAANRALLAEELQRFIRNDIYSHISSIHRLHKKSS